mmetsp:Transcript_42525/g.97453  ORF Transcript_42525/g.97453 Transcript_42525/m.97453 type:complete len:248 (-) Transcript_42525:1652-2395(-)
MFGLSQVPMMLVGSPGTDLQPARMDSQVAVPHPSKAALGCLIQALAISPQSPSAFPTGSRKPHPLRQHSIEQPCLQASERLCKILMPTCQPRPMRWRFPTIRATTLAPNGYLARGPPRNQPQLCKRYPRNQASSHYFRRHRHLFAWMNSYDRSTSERMMELEWQCRAMLVDMFHGSALLPAWHRVPLPPVQRHLQTHPACWLCSLHYLRPLSPSGNSLQGRQPPAPSRQRLSCCMWCQLHPSHEACV